MKTKKLSIALAGVMSAMAAAGAAPLGTAAFLQNMAAVANAASWSDGNFDGNRVINEDLNIDDYCQTSIGNNGKCVVVVNGNMNIGEYTNLYVNSDSILIVNGNVSLSSFSNLFYGTVILTGSLTIDYYSDVSSKLVTEKNLTNIGYVAETDEYYEYFTSGGNIYTFNGNEFVQTTLDALKKSVPATAEFDIVNEYETETGDESADTASLWTVTVTAGTESISTLDIKLGDIASQEGAQTLDTPAITNAEVILGVVTNLSVEDVEAKGGFTVIANGSAI